MLSKGPHPMERNSHLEDEWSQHKIEMTSM